MPHSGYAALHRVNPIKKMDVSFYDYTLQRNESGFDTEAIGVSPIKKVSSRDKTSYGRNKLKRIKADTEDYTSITSPPRWNPPLRREGAYSN